MIRIYVYALPAVAIHCISQQYYSVTTYTYCSAHHYQLTQPCRLHVFKIVATSKPCMHEV